MKRTEWILSGLLAAIIIFVLAMLLLFWSQQRQDNQNLNLRDSLVEGVRTARAAHALASPLARQWASDAELLSARGTWAEGEFEPEAGNWSLIFYSTRSNATALFAVADGEVSLVTSGPADRALRLADVSRWEIDSPAVVQTLMAAGGTAFIEEHDDANMVLSLQTHEGLQWTATLIAPSASEALSVKVDAASGTVQQTTS